LKTNVRHQWFKDEPFRYFHNHHGRKFASEYTTEDRGYRMPCWISNRTKNEHGYTSMRFGGKMMRTHRVFYERKYGQVPDGKKLDHLCRVPACCNPDHLEPVSHRENVRRGNSAKITLDMERQIVDLLQNKSLRQSDIAAMFDLEQTAVSKIWRKHFPFDRNRLRSHVTHSGVHKG
jgi:predicted XRE-type DNA-binding protein